MVIYFHTWLDLESSSIIVYYHLANNFARWASWLVTLALFLFLFFIFLMCSKGGFHLESQALNPLLSSFFFWWQTMKASISKINTTRRLSGEINSWTIMHPSNKTNITGGQSCKTSKLPKTQKTTGGPSFIHQIKPYSRCTTCIHEVKAIDT